jgi:hypothetical protein
VFTVIFTQAARAELIEAQEWYEGEARGLGRRFRERIDTLAGRMSANPRQFPVVFKSVRRALLRRFPLRVVFCHRRAILICYRLFPCQPRSFAMATAGLNTI